MTYPTVDKLVGRIRARTGVEFTAHMLRHTHATDLSVAACRSRSSPSCSPTALRRTTSETYIHLETTDIRRALQRPGCGARSWSHDEVRRADRAADARSFLKLVHGEAIPSTPSTQLITGMLAGSASRLGEGVTRPASTPSRRTGYATR